MPELDVRNREPSKSQKQSDSLTRRNFLKTTAVAAGAVALGSSSGCGSIASNIQSYSVGEEQKFISGCQHLGCGGCQGIVTVRDGKVVNLNTWDDNPEGKIPCSRGRAHWQRIYTAERVKYPMKRAGERMEDKWERISWDEAISTIAEKWNGYFKEYGSQSVAVFGTGAVGGGYINAYLVQRLRNILQLTNASGCSDYGMAKGLNKVFGPAYNTWGCPPFDIENLIYSNAIISWSGNIPVASTYSWYHVTLAREKGCKVVAVDPSFTAMAQKADLWVRPRPGTDTVLQFGMMRYIIDNSLIDEEFLLAYSVAPILIRNDTKRYLRMSDLGVAPTEGPIDPMTGQPVVIDPPVVWDSVTNGYGSLDSVELPSLRGSHTINGIQVDTAYDLLIKLVDEWPLEKASELSEVPVETIEELARIAADGPVYHYTGYGSQSYNNGVQTGHALGTIGALTGNICKKGAGVSNGYFAPTFNLAYIMPTGTMATDIPALAMFDVMTTGKYMGKNWPIKSICLWGCGLIGGTVDTNRTMQEIIENAEFIVTMDVVFSDQARVADILLPVAHNYEYDEIFNSGSFAKWDEKVVDPAFESKPDGEIARLLGEALGVGQFFNKTDDDYLHEALDTDSMREAGITVERVQKDKAYRYRSLDWLPSTTFPTGTGRMEFYMDAPFPRMDFGQQFDFDAEHLPRWFPPTEAWSDNPVMQDYPLVFMSERARNRIHSLDYEAIWLNEIEPEPIIRLNPNDARTRNIKEGDYVKVFNMRGHAVARLRLSEAMRPGTVSYPKGWQVNQFKSGCWGELHNSEFDPVGVNNSYFDSVCEVQKWEEV
jgi:molybdopterin-containing oxidoreductase family molybdopterin binding subunit